MATAEILRLTQIVDNRVTTVDNKVTTVDNKVTAVDDKVTTVDHKVTTVVNGERRLSNWLHLVLNAQTFVRRQRNKASCPTNSKQRRRHKMFVIHPVAPTSDNPNVLTGCQVRESLRRWVTPPDPSTNHTIACGIQHDGSAQWFFRGSIFSKWKSTGSLLWIYGKRMFVLVHARPIADHLHILSRLREEHPLVSRRSNLYRSKTSLPWRVVLQSSRTYKHHAKRD